LNQVIWHFLSASAKQSTRRAYDRWNMETFKGKQNLIEVDRVCLFIMIIIITAIITIVIIITATIIIIITIIMIARVSVMYV
jgi:type IV secretory pathway VirB6-like protein